MTHVIYSVLLLQIYNMENVIQVQDIIKASYRLNGIVSESPLQKNLNLSDKFGANVYLKREDLQIVRSYKIRGAYNLMVNLSQEERKKGVVCASAGNHAQGFAYSCHLLGIKGKIYMPTTTPSQKINRVKYLGKEKVTIVLFGDSFDAANAEALLCSQETGMTLVPPFDHQLIIEGQGTVGVEILNQFKGQIDYLFIPIGGGGLSSGVGSFFKKISPETKIIGVEPENADSMKRSVEKGTLVTLDYLDTFVDGAAVKRAGTLNFEICKQVLDDICIVAPGSLCSYILKLYNEDAIVVEPAGVLSIAALDLYADKIKGKNVVCVVSGGNNDIERMPDIKERSLIYEGLKHYFIVQFPQRAGALLEFVSNVLGPNDSITYFEYGTKQKRNSGAALVGIELKNREDYKSLIHRMNTQNFKYTVINKNPTLYNFLI